MQRRLRGQGDGHGGPPWGAEKAAHGPQHLWMREERPVTTVLDDDRAASVAWGRHEDIVGSEDGELPVRSPVRVIRRAERGEPPHVATVSELDEVARDQPAEAVADDVDLGGAGRAADVFDVLPEVTSDGLIGGPGGVGE